jgi:hypothetical protein
LSAAVGAYAPAPRDNYADADADQRFEFLLGIFVDGLAQRTAG